MPHETALVATIAVSLGLAFLLGFAATALRLPPLLGYLLAGVLVGPFTPGLSADPRLAQQLADLGVILLMFGVGIHFSLADLLAVRKIAVPGALVQIGAATLFGAGAAHLWGWSWSAGLVFGFCLSVASTVVLLRTLEDRRMLESVDGRIAVGWLVVEDLATVFVLVLLPLTVTLQTPGLPSGERVTGTGLVLAVALTLLKVGLFVGLMLVVGRRVVPWLLERVARKGSRELFTLSVLAVALVIAVGAAAYFDVSLALGAFVAGMVVNSSNLSREAARDALPLQDAFSVLFFVAVGMLFDPAILLRSPLAVLAVVSIVMVGKSLGAFLIVLIFRYPLGTALTISASLAQIGEFSFILAGLGVQLGVLTMEAQSLIVAAALISIAVNPLYFLLTSYARRWISARPRLLALLERPGGGLAELPEFVEPPELVGHAVIVGFGRVGGLVGEALARCEVPYIVVEQNRETVEALRVRGLPVISGDATRPEVLRRTRLEHARLLIAATPEPYQTRAIIEHARKVNPRIEAVARAHNEEERAYLEQHGVALALIGERELALGLAEHALTQAGCGGLHAAMIVEELRRRPQHHEPEAPPPPGAVP